MNNKTGEKRIGLFSGIRTKMLLYFGLLFIITISLLELSRIYGMPFTEFMGEHSIEQAKVFDNLSLVADLKKERLERLLTEMQNDITMFSKDPFVKLSIVELKRKIQENIDNGISGETLWAEVKKWGTFKELSLYLNLINNSYATYNEPKIFDLKTGVTLAWPGDLEIGTFIYEDSYQHSIFNRDTLEKAFKHGDIYFHVGMHKGEENIDFDIYAPIRDSEMIVAVLKLDINVSDFILPLLHTGGGLGKTGEALLVDHERRILTPLKHPLPDETVPKPLEYKILAKPALFASRGEEGLIMSEDYRGIDVLAAYRHIPITSEAGWGMVVKKDKDEVFYELNKTMKYSFIISVFGVFAFCILIFVFINKITNPIMNLREAAIRVGHGDLETTMTITSKDEIGDLADDFNEMRLKLKDSYSGLEEKVREKTEELVETLKDSKERNVDLRETRDAMLNLVEDLETSKEALEEEKLHLEDIKIKLQVLNAELNNKNKELESILFAASHDLRTPLVNIQGFGKELQYTIDDLTAELQKMEIPPDIKNKVSSLIKDDIPESLSFIRTGTAKMDALLSALLQISRLGRFQLVLTDIDMNTLMADVLNSLEYKLKDSKIKIEVDDLPSCTADSTQINQVFTNLIENAIKYHDPSRDGIIKVSGYVEKDKTIYCVEDNGIGIAPEYQDQIFKLFHRLEPEKNIGEGLGLTIIQKIIDKHNGDIRVESEEGRGSKFFVTLAQKKEDSV